MRLLLAVALLAMLISPVAAQPSFLQPDPALRGLAPSFISVSVSANAENRGRCGLSEDLAAMIYTTLVQSTTRHGLALPALTEVERVTNDWQIASGGQTRAGPGQPPELPMLTVSIALWGTGDGRCFFSGLAELTVTVSGTMVTAHGPRPLTSVATVWRRQLSMWTLASAGQQLLSRNISTLADDLAQALRP